MEIFTKPVNYLSKVRKALKVKGRSIHSGRGFYECDYDCTPQELMDRFNKIVERWEKKGKIANIERHANRISFEFPLEDTQACGYNGFSFSLDYPYNYACYMCITDPASWAAKMTQQSEQITEAQAQ
jgi:hypothetical protein